MKKYFLMSSAAVLIGALRVKRSDKNSERADFKKYALSIIIEFVRRSQKKLS